MISRQSRKRKSSRKYSGLSSYESQKLPKDINNLRPPSVWNYPIYRLDKIYIDGGQKKEIRNVDPSLCYKDGRVDRFKKLFENIYKEMVLYFQTAKADLWDYFFNKCLKALRISYVTNKELKAEEELRKQIEEEMRKQEEEERKKEEEREKELERLKIRKKRKENYIRKKSQKILKIKEKNRKEEKKDEKTESKQGKENNNNRISSAKPSKEVANKQIEKQLSKKLSINKK